MDKVKLDNTNSINETETLKMMHANVYDELNRGRDWPLKAFGICIGIEALVISGIVSSSEKISTHQIYPSIIASVGILIIAIYTSIIILRQHKNYIEYRRIQRRIQHKMNIQKIKINGELVFPFNWSSPNNIKTKGINIGVGYYLTLLWIITFIAMSICIDIIYKQSASC